MSEYSRLYYLKNKEKMKAYVRAFHEANQDYAKSYYLRNKEKMKAQAAAFHEAHRAERIEKARIRSQEIRDANPEESRAKGRAQHNKHRDKIAAKGKARRQAIALQKKPAKDAAREAAKVANRAKQKKANAAYYIKNREHRKAYLKKWRAEHPEAREKSNAKRRASLYGAKIGDLNAIFAWKKKVRAMPVVICHWCGKKLAGADCWFDHVIPVALCGPEEIDNYCIACKPCNLAKNATHPADFNLTLTQPLLFP